MNQFSIQNIAITTLIIIFLLAYNVVAMSMLNQKLASVLLQANQLTLPTRACIFVAGGGSGAISTLAATPGASSVLLEGLLAYDQRSFLDCVKDVNSSIWSSDVSFCSKEAALALSNAALKRSLSLTPRISQWQQCVGVGCTSALVSNTPKKGDHRCFVALTSVDGTSNVYSLILSKESGRSRSSEDEVVSMVVLRALSRQWISSSGNIAENGLCKDFEETIAKTTKAMLVDNEHIVSECISSDEAITTLTEAADIVASKTYQFALLAPSQSPTSSCELSTTSLTSLPRNPIIFPGSFNPPHAGHLQLAQAAINAVKRRYHEIGLNDRDVAINMLFELSITNPDKPPIPSEMVTQRIQGFTSPGNKDHLPCDWGVLLSSAPLFSQKVDIFSKHLPIDSNNTTGTRMFFVIGSDTMVRIIDPKYYNGSESEMLDAVRSMNELGVHFIVGGRLEQKTAPSEIPKFIDGKEELKLLPHDLQSMFTILAREEFRVDISSSQIRAAAEATKV